MSSPIYPENELGHIEAAHRQHADLLAKNSGNSPIDPGDIVAHDDANPGCVKRAETFTIKDSGERRKTDSGAQRDRAEGKGRYDLLPFFALRRLAVHYEGGAKKYDPNNWLKGMPMSWFADSAMRHLCKALAGAKDEDHWTAAAWNILAVIEYQERIFEDIMDPKWDDLTMLPKQLTPIEMMDDGPPCPDIYKALQAWRNTAGGNLGRPPEQEYNG